jgi:hypothetical protein
MFLRAPTRNEAERGGGVKTIGRIALAATLSATTLAFAQRASVRHAPTIYAFTNVAVLAMDAERLVADQTVIVRDNHIEIVGPSTTVSVPASATRIDGRGKYLMPGLAEMHAVAAAVGDRPSARRTRGENGAQVESPNCLLLRPVLRISVGAPGIRSSPC